MITCSVGLTNFGSNSPNTSIVALPRLPIVPCTISNLSLHVMRGESLVLQFSEIDCSREKDTVCFLRKDVTTCLQAGLNGTF
jgi:hypothetical protein